MLKIITMAPMMVLFMNLVTVGPSLAQTQSSPALTANEATTSLTKEQLAWQRIANGAVVIDTRTAREFAQGHLENAINIPFDVIVAGVKQHNISKDQAIVVYCRSGRRSGRAEASLHAAGYQNLHNGGGYQTLLQQQ